MMVKFTDTMKCTLNPWSILKLFLKISNIDFQDVWIVIMRKKYIYKLKYWAPVSGASLLKVAYSESIFVHDYYVTSV